MMADIQEVDISSKFQTADDQNTHPKLWVTKFFHSFPHVDFQFHTVNSTFGPNSDTYRQAVALWALVPVAACFLLWLIFFVYFIFRCCQRQRRVKGHLSFCLKLFIALLILSGLGLIGFGFYKNENVHSAVNEIKDSRQNVNDLLTSASEKVGLLNSLASDVSDRLSGVLEKAANNITNTTVRTLAVQLIGRIQQEAEDAHNYLDSIKVDKPDDNTLDEVFGYEYIRWLVTIGVLSLYVIILLTSFVGLLVRSRTTLIICTTTAVICSIFIWVATGAYLGVSVATGDLCTDPDTYFISLAQGSSIESTVLAYIKCADPSQPYKQVIDNATSAVTYALSALNETVTLALPYNVTGIEAVVAEMRADLYAVIGNLTLLVNSVGSCPTLHEYYVEGVNSVCTDAISDTAFLALICCVVAVVCTILIFCFSCVWRRFAALRPQAQYVSVDDKDPFLPHPPPYETDYGTMGQSNPRPWADRGTVQQTGIPGRNDHTMNLIQQYPMYPVDDSPPPAYHPGQYLQRYAESGPSPYSMRSRAAN